MSRPPYDKEDLELLMHRLRYALELFDHEPWLGCEHHGFEFAKHEGDLGEIEDDHKGRRIGRFVTKTYTITCRCFQPSI